MSPSRREAIIKSMAECRLSQQKVAEANKLHALAHNRFNDIVVRLPRPGRYSGAQIAELQLYATASYEALIDAMLEHSNNIAHLSAIGGKYRDG